LPIKEYNTAVALGLFDGLHLGHVEVIKAAMLKDEYIPAVFTFNDKSPLPKMKEQENIISFSQKTKLFNAVGVKKILAVDFNDTKDLTADEFVENILIKELNAKYVCCGYDFRFGREGKSGPGDLKKICSKHGIVTKKIPAILVDGKAVSSSEIRRCIKDGDIQKANLLLGYELMYELPVIRGRKLGRKLSVPTINQRFPETNLLPRPGVYKSWAEIDGFQYRSITNIGFKPTVGSDSPIIETHLLGFREELEIYEQLVTISLVDFIRDERKFANVEELRAQIEEDIRKVRSN